MQNLRTREINYKLMENEQKTSAAAQTKNAGDSKDDKVKNLENANNKIKDVQDAKKAVKETANKAAGQAKNKAAGILDEKKSNLATGLNDVAGSIRKVGESLREADDQTSIGKVTSQYGDNLAGMVENFSSYLEDARIKDLTRDVEDLAHRQPALFIGGAFALGLLAARFLKSSGSGESNDYPTYNNYSRYNEQRNRA